MHRLGSGFGLMGSGGGGSFATKYIFATKPPLHSSFEQNFHSGARDSTAYRLTPNPEPFHNIYAKNAKETIACIFF